jgi:hypothetical protein
MGRMLRIDPGGDTAPAGRVFFFFYCLVGEVRSASRSFPSGSSQKIPALVLRILDAKRSDPKHPSQIRSIRVKPSVVDASPAEDEAYV